MRQKHRRDAGLCRNVRDIRCSRDNIGNFRSGIAGIHAAYHKGVGALGDLTEFVARPRISREGDYSFRSLYAIDERNETGFTSADGGGLEPVPPRCW